MNTITRFHHVAAGVVAISLVAGACSSGGSEQANAATSEPEAAASAEVSEPTTTATTTDVVEDGIERLEILDPTFLADTVERVSIVDGGGGLLLAVFDAEGEPVEASVGSDADGSAPTATDAFRIGSITKVFTALATMQLVEEGSIDLDAPAADYISRFAVADGVTVRHLLSHRSGIYNVTDVGSFFPAIFDEPSREWTAEDQVELVADEAPVFEPGERFSYSNTNYVILGVLLEEVTGEAYHEVIRTRIIDPLQLDSTYLAGPEEGPALFDPFTGPDGADPDYDYTSLNTAAWAAGAMVSSAGDLHRLFTAVYDGQIVTEETLEEMTAGDDYGFGLELWEKSDGLVGHSGGIPGYSTFVRHDPDSGITAFLASTADLDPGPVTVPVVRALGNAS